jgi:hypothetical protein
MTLDDDALRSGAGDYVAGDLDHSETARFRALLQDSEPLRKETDFWQGLRGAWNDHVSAESLGPGFAASVLARAPRAQPEQRVIRLPIWAVALTSAAAAALLMVFLLPASAQPGAMYAEDGASLVATGPTGPWQDYLPRALVTTVNLKHPSGSTITNHVKPWVGLWTRPITVSGDAGQGAGHLVLRIAGGSPADHIGLKPGDIISTINQCPVFTPSCIAHQLEDAHPGDVITVHWWRPTTGEQFTESMTLEALFE